MAESSSTSSELMGLLLMACGTMVEKLQNKLREVGFDDVRPQHGFTFQLLSFGGANVNEIAEHLGVTKQAASQMLEYLEQRGYIMRHPDERDGRSKIVMLTNRGWDCIKHTEAILTQLETEWNNYLGQERMSQLQIDLRSLILKANNGSYPRRLRPGW